MDDCNPKILASDNFNACDASGFFWARGRATVEPDGGAKAENITRVGGGVNRGRADRVALHDTERHATFNSIWRRLNDTP